MNEQENLQVVQKMYAASGQGDIPSFLGFLSEDVEWAVPGPKDIPNAGIYYGHAQVVQLFMNMGESLELQQYKPLEFIAQNDRVVVTGHASGRVRANNHPLEYDWVQVYTLRDGKTVKFREYLDTAAIAKAYCSAKVDSFA